MKNLEKEFGVPLFVRTRNKIAFNEYGKLAVHHAMHIAESIAYLKDSVRTLYQQDHSVCIASCGPAPLWSLPYLIQDYYPGTVVSSRICSMPEIRKGLENDTVQLGVFAGPVSDPAFVCKKCVSEQLHFSVSKDHPLASRDNISFEEINGESVIVVSSMGYWSDVVTQMMDKSHFVLKDFDKDFVSCVETTGLPFFSSDLTQREKRFAPGRVELPIRDREARVDFYVVCKQSVYGHFKEVFDCLEVL